MKNYFKPSQNCQNPSHFVSHVGTNDLKSEKSRTKKSRTMQSPLKVKYTTSAYLTSYSAPTMNKLILMQLKSTIIWLIFVRKWIFLILLWLLIQNQWKRNILTTAGFTWTKKGLRFLLMWTAKKLSKFLNNTCI